MRKEVRIPQQGFTTEYVSITEWHVCVGDWVEEGMPLCTMESDKAVAEVESPCAGTVAEILKAENEEAGIGEAVLLLDV